MNSKLCIFLLFVLVVSLFHKNILISILKRQHLHNDDSSFEINEQDEEMETVYEQDEEMDAK